MATHVVKVPDIGEGVAEVELVAWRVRPGDRVESEQPLCDVMTDKATVEIPSPVAGTVLALGGAVGQVLAVGSELIRIDVARQPHGRGVSADKAAAHDSIAPLAATAKPTLDRATELTDSREAGAHESLRSSTPHADARSGAAAASGKGADFSFNAHPHDSRPIASPAVRRRAWELGIDLNEVAPTGTAGRIMHADLDAHLAKHGGGSRASAAAPAAAASAASARVTMPDEPRASSGEQTETLTGLRRRIAQKMQEAKRRIPHFSYVEEVDVTELEALRASLNDARQQRGPGDPTAQRGDADRPRLTLLPLLLRAIVLAVRDVPEVNARFDDEAGRITRFAAVHAGIATQTDAGLMVPVLRNADALDLWQTAAEIARLAAKARAGRATRDELSGSTITVTSLGALGGIVSTPVINHPEVAIVGVNRIVRRPMLLAGGAIGARDMMNLSSSFDHRVIDGLIAARFVQRIRARLERPALLFVE